jgi:hypothetical protein
MAISVADFKIFFPEFATESDARIEVFLNAAELRVSEKVFKSSYALVIFYLAAHMLSVAKNSEAGGGFGQGTKGSISAEKVGDLSISYGSNPNNPSVGASAEIASTIYGRAYLQLRKEKVVSVTLGNSGVYL